MSKRTVVTLLFVCVTHPRSRAPDRARLQGGTRFLAIGGDKFVGGLVVVDAEIPQSDPGDTEGVDAILGEWTPMAGTEDPLERR